MENNQNNSLPNPDNVEYVFRHCIDAQIGSFEPVAFNYAFKHKSVKIINTDFAQRRTCSEMKEYLNFLLSCVDKIEKNYEGNK